MAVKTEDKINFKFHSDKIEEFRLIVGDLSKISPLIKFKITKESLFLYSIDTAGDGSQGTALAVKSFIFPINYFIDIKNNEYIDNDNNENSPDIDWIIKDGRVLVKKLSFFKNKESDIKGVFNLRQLQGTNTLYNRLLVLTDSKFKFSLTGDEANSIRDLSIDQLNTLLDPEKSDITFSIPSTEFLSAKSISDIESEEMISINLNNGKIYIRQSSWELLVGNNIELEGNRTVTFNKKYLKSINPKVDTISISVFENFILWSEGNQKFMISFEQNF